MKCPNCKYEFPDNDAEFCPSCGEDLKAESIMNEPTVVIPAEGEAGEAAPEKKTVDLSEGETENEIDTKDTVEVAPAVSVLETDDKERDISPDIPEDTAEEAAEAAPETEESVKESEEEKEPTLSSVTFAAIEEELMAMEAEDKAEAEAEAEAEPEPEPAPVKNIEIAPAPTPLADLSEVWPEWHVDKKLGRGSYGSVYRAVRRDSNVESFAAVKVISIPQDPSEIESLRCEGLDDQSTKAYFKSIVDDFVSEISLMESLKGIQNIVSVEDYKVVEKSGTIGWDIYIRMELLTPFIAFIRDRIMTERQVLALGIDICTALEICQKCNIIHRDIKPENIFINSFGHYKLGDFGIARKLENVTGVLSHKGTYNYMAPEVANNGRYDARVDTYSLGIMLYRLLNNNRLPFIDSQKQALSPNDRRLAVERRISGEPLPAPMGASLAMTDVILRACAFDPEDRFPTPTAMKAALISVAKGTYVVRAKTPATPKAPPAPASPVVPPRNQDPATILFAPAAGTQPSSQSTVLFDPAGTQGPVAVDSFTRETPKAKKKKTDKAKNGGPGKGVILAIIAVCAILALIGGTTAFYYFSPGHSVAKSFTTDKYVEALELYHDKVEKNGLQEFILNMHLSDYSSKIVERYKKGELDLAKAHTALYALAEMGYADAKKEDEKILSQCANDCLTEFSSGKITYKEAKAQIMTLKGYGYKNADSNLRAIMKAYADTTVDSFNNGELSYDETIKILTDLKKEGYAEADAEINKLMSEEITAIVEDYMRGDVDYAKAVELLCDLRDDGQDVDGALETIRESYASSVLGQYRSGELEYNDALAILNALKEEGSTAAESAIESLDAINAEDELLKEAEALFADGKYAEALETLEPFTKDSERSEEAEELRESICDAYAEAVLTSSEALLAEGDYKGAADALTAAIEAFPKKADTDELEDELESILEEHREYVSETVETLCEEENFEEAMSLIEESEWNVESEKDKFFKNLRETVEESCVAAVTESVEAYIESGEAEIGKQMVDNALVLFPENEDLKSLHEAVLDAIAAEKAEEEKIDAYLGVVFENVTDSETAYDLFESEEIGVYVTETEPDLNDSVLEYGDRVINVEGTEITDKAQIDEIVADHEFGDIIVFKIVRDETEMTVSVYCYKTPEASEN